MIVQDVCLFVYCRLGRRRHPTGPKPQIGYTQYYKARIHVTIIDESVHWYWYWFFQSTDHFWYWCTGTGTGTGPVFKYWLCTGTDRPSTESISTSTNKVKKQQNSCEKIGSHQGFQNMSHISPEMLFHTWISLMKFRFFSRKFQISNWWLGG